MHINLRVDLTEYTSAQLQEMKMIIEIELANRLDKPKKDFHLKNWQQAKKIMSTRLYNRLKCLDIIYISQIGEYTEADFFKERNIGESTMNELKKLMQEYDITFKT